MIPFDRFLLDPPMLFGSGWLTAKITKGSSGVFRFDHRNVSTRTHAVSAAILATYPAWLWMGIRAGERARYSRT